MLSLLALLGSVKNDASRVIFNTSVFRVYNQASACVPMSQSMHALSKLTLGATKPLHYMSCFRQRQRYSIVSYPYLKPIYHNCVIFRYIRFACTYICMSSAEQGTKLSMDIKEYQCISMDINGFQWISI